MSGVLVLGLADRRLAVLPPVVVVDRESRNALGDEEDGKEPEHDEAETVVPQEALHVVVLRSTILAPFAG